MKKKYTKDIEFVIWSLITRCPNKSSLRRALNEFYKRLKLEGRLQ